MFQICNYLLLHILKSHILPVFTKSVRFMIASKDWKAKIEANTTSQSLKQISCYKVSSPPQQLLCMSIHRLFEKTETTSRIAAISPKQERS